MIRPRKSALVSYGICAKAQLGRMREELDLMDVILCIFYCAKGHQSYVGRAICNQIAWNLYASVGAYLAPTTFEIRGGVAVNPEINTVIDELCELSHVIPMGINSFAITQNGQKFFESRISSTKYAGVYFEIVNRMKVLLSRMATCNLEDAISILVAGDWANAMPGRGDVLG